MERKLTRVQTRIYHYDVNGKRVDGTHDRIWGNVFGISGDVSGISGDVFGIRGNVTGIIGDATGISGDLGACNITDEDRKRGISISELIAPTT